jgi:hypothetical protein
LNVKNNPAPAGFVFLILRCVAANKKNGGEKFFAALPSKKEF